MIKTSEVQQAYQQGRQAAMVKLSFNLFEASGLNPFSGWSKTTELIGNNNSAEIARMEEQRRVAASAIQEAKDQGYSKMLEDLHKKRYYPMVRNKEEYLESFPDGNPRVGEVIESVWGQKRLKGWLDRQIMPENLDKLMKNTHGAPYPSALEVYKNDPSLGTALAIDLLAKQHVRHEGRLLNGLYDSNRFLDEPPISHGGRHGQPSSNYGLPEGSALAKATNAYHTATKSSYKKLKHIEKALPALKKVREDSRYTDTSYLTPQNINRLAMLTGTVGGGYLGDFTPRALGVSLAGSVAGNLLGGAVGSSIDAYRGGDKTWAPVVGSSVGAVGSGLLAGKYLS